MIVDIRSPQYRYNPYPTFKQLRRNAPVCRIKSHDYWMVSRYTDVQMILKNQDIFSSSGICKEPTDKGPTSLLYSRGMVGVDEPDHGRLRRLLGKTLTPPMIRNFEPTIRLICENLIKTIANKKIIEFVRDYSMPFPIIFIAKLMGMDVEKKNDFKRWVNILITWRNQKLTSEILSDVEQMYYYFKELITERRHSPKNDLVSALVLASENDQSLTSEEVLDVMRLLLVAGTETTTNLLGNAMLALLSHPDSIQQTSQNYSNIPNFIEESLRYDGPSVSLIRRVKSDIEIAGCAIRKDEIVLPLLGSANHDESVFANPEQFDISRNAKGHLAFGTGIHHCLGSQLARLQARIAFEEFFNNFKSIKRKNDEPLQYLDSFYFRGVRELYLEIK